MPRRAPKLSAEEQAFLDGPCETLCRMLDDFDITHRRADLPPEVWEYIKAQGFFAMIIPKRYGGLEFSTYAHSCVLVKLAAPQRHLRLHGGGAQLARARRNCWCTTAPRSRRTTTCRGWRAARKSPASR